MKNTMNLACFAVLTLYLFQGISLCTVIEMEAGKEIEWKKPEEPTDLAEAGRMKKEAQEKRDEAEKAMKEAQEKGEQEEATKEELKYQDARYELRTSLIGEARIKAKDDPSYENKAKSIIEKQEKERQAIEDQIKKITQQLKTIYEKPTEPKKQVGQKVTDFQENMTEDFKNVTDRDYPVSQFIDDHFYFAKTIREQGLPDYASQKEALTNLKDFLNKNVSKEVFDKLTPDEKSTYEQTQKDITSRIQEINDFLNNPPPKITGNDLVTKLNLSSKIPRDQIADVRGEINRMLVDEGISKEEKISTITKAIQAFEGYKLTEKAPDLFQFYKDTIDDLKPKKEEYIEIPAGLGDALSKGFDLAKQGVDFTSEKMGDFATTVKDNASSFLAQTGEKVGDFVTRKIEENPEYIDPVYEQIAKAGKGLYDAKKYANKMEKVPDLVDKAVLASKVINTPVVGSLTEPIIKRAIGQKAFSILKVIADNPNTVRPAVQNLVSPAAESLAPYVKSLGDWGKSLAERVTEERIKLKGPEAKQKLERAKNIIEQERTNYLTPEKRSRFADVFKPVKEFFSSVKNWIKDQITTIKFKNAVENYNTARNDYLERLFPDEGELDALNKLDENTRNQKIKAKLAELRKYPALRSELNEYDQKLAKTTYDLAQVYKTFANKLDGAFTNIEFMIKAWDSVYYDPKAKQDLIGTINNIADLRDQRLSYLLAMREGIDSIKKDLSDATGANAQGLNDVFTQRLDTMLNGQMIKTIQENQQMINVIDTALKQVAGSDSIGLPPG